MAHLTVLMRRLASGILIFGLSMSISGCGGGTSDDQRSEVQKDRAKLESRYQIVQGAYVGTIQGVDPSEAPTRIELNLYIDYKDEGVDADGNPKFLPVLLGRFQLPEVVGENDRERLKVDFDEMSGKVLMTRLASAAAGGASGSSAFSISGALQGEELTGEVVRNGGVWGRLQAKRVSQKSASPAGGEDEDERRRREKVFGPLAGVYAGTMDAPGLDYDAKLTLLSAQQSILGPSGQEILVPSLVARFSRNDWEDAGIAWLMSRVSYNSANQLITLGSSEADAASRGSATIPGSGLLFGTGRIGSGSIDIEFSNSRGFFGRFRGLKVKTAP